MATRSFLRTRRAFLLAASLTFALGLTPAAALADPAGGECGASGNNLAWQLTDDGKLAISGAGDMASYAAEGQGAAPWLNNRSDIKSIVVGQDVTSIGDNAFNSCASLESVSLPDGLQKIGNKAFYGCKSLQSLTIPDSVSQIGESAFAACDNLAAITIKRKSDVGLALGENAFYGAKATSAKLEWTGEEPRADQVLNFGVSGDQGGSIDNSGDVPVLTWSGATGATRLLGTMETLYDVNVENGTPAHTTAAQGQTVTITADKPADGMAFVQWASQEVDSFSPADSMEATFEMPNKAVTVTAVYAPIVIEGFDNVTCEYDGAPKEPSPSGVYLKGVDSGGANKELVLGTDYTLSYKNNVHVGTATLTVTMTGGKGSASKDFNITPADIEKAAVEVKDQVYGDKPSATVTWKVGNDTVTLVEGTDYTLTIEPTTVGEATMTVTGIGNFTGTQTAKTTITQRPLTLTASTDKKVYDGTPLTAGYTADDLAEGDKIDSIKVTGSLTDVGSVESTVSDAEIVNAKGENVTSNYKISYVSGKLEVTKRPATITVTAASKVQGAADPAFTGTVEGLAKDGDLGTVAYSRTNKDEAPGTYKGVLTASYTANNNYDVTVKSADFTIKRALTAVWLDGDDKTELQRSVYGEGDPVPAFTGKTPTKAETELYTYTFREWDEGTTEGTTTTYRPLFDEVRKTGILTFDLAGGTLDGKTGTLTMKANVGDTIKLPAAPTRSWYTFVCWKGSEYKAGAAYKVEGDHTFTAEWAKVYPAPTMSNSKGGGFASTSDEITYTILQEVPDHASTVRIWVELPGVQRFTTDASGVTITLADGSGVSSDLAKAAIDGQRLTVTVAADTLHGKTLKVTYRAKLRDDADLSAYLNDKKDTASVPYQAHTVFDGDESHTVASKEESVKFKVSSSTASAKTTLAKTSDLTSYVFIVTLALLGAVALAAGVTVYRARRQR